jgi:hypothetical protein
MDCEFLPCSPILEKFIAWISLIHVASNFRRTDAVNRFPHHEQSEQTRSEIDSRPDAAYHGIVRNFPS